MESNKILQADLLDILFEDRNKEYGAYQLRKTYNRRLVKAMFATGSVILLLFVGGMVMGRNGGKMVIPAEIKDVDITAVDTRVEPPPTPPPVRVEAPRVETIRFMTTKIVPDQEVPEEQRPPENDQADQARIGLENMHGVADDGTQPAPPSPEGARTGVTEEPVKKDPDDGGFVPVEVESTYPGGVAAWARFLNHNLNFPEGARNIDVQGVVIVQFIVDEVGNVSDVKAVGGPEQGGLREEAVRVIRKSGKWDPALQNGRKVKSYKRQPITFKLAEE